MSTTTVTVGNGTTGSFTEITLAGTYDVVVQGGNGVLYTTGSIDTTILTITEQGVLFTDEISGNAVQDFNPTTLNTVVPFLDLGYAPGASVEPGYGTLELGNNLVNDNFNPPLYFGGTHNDLIIGSSLTAAAVSAINNYGYTDTIDLQGVTGATSAVWTQNSGTTGGTLSLYSGTDTDLADVTLATGSFTSALFSITSDGAGGTDITVACYRAGTRIATPDGETDVEALAIGDRVLTADGTAQPIKWVGRRSYSARFAAGKTHLLPIRFAQGALGNGRPRRTLWVSPAHAMLIDGALVPAAALTNGTSIVQDDTPGRIDYIHIELDRHSVIFAEGAASETYVDDDNRAMFHNAADYASRYGTTTQPARYCTTRIDSGPQLHAIHTRLAALAGTAPPPAALGPLHGWLERIETDTTSPEPAAWAVGWAISPQSPEIPVCFELLHRGRPIHRGLATIHRPDVEDAGFGSGRCGFRIPVPATARLDDLIVRRIADHATLAAATSPAQRAA
jgi:hypothetical protein